MKTICPKCYGKNAANCKVCKGAGEIEAGVPPGIMFTRQCPNPLCKFQNGRFIVEPGSPTGPNGEPPQPAGTCPLCMHKTAWLRLGEVTK